MPNCVHHPIFRTWIYRQRNAVERFFNRLKHFRVVASLVIRHADIDRMLIVQDPTAVRTKNSKLIELVLCDACNSDFSNAY